MHIHKIDTINSSEKIKTVLKHKQRVPIYLNQILQS